MIFFVVSEQSGHAKPADRCLSFGKQDDPFKTAFRRPLNARICESYSNMHSHIFCQTRNEASVRGPMGRRSSTHHREKETIHCTPCNRAHQEKTPTPLRVTRRFVDVADPISASQKRFGVSQAPPIDPARPRTIMQAVTAWYYTPGVGASTGIRIYSGLNGTP